MTNTKILIESNYSIVTGYDGINFKAGDRVEMHPGTDLWMRGARYGEVVQIRPTEKDRVVVRLDKFPNAKFPGPVCVCGSEDTFRKVL